MDARDRIHGYFADPATGLLTRAKIVVAWWCVDGSRDMITDRPVLYVDPKGRRHYVPERFRTNGLSVPRVFWRLIQPFEPLAREASVVHDWLCAVNWDWNDAAWVFYHAMRANGVNRVSAFLRWAAVRFVGCWFKCYNKP